MNPLLLMAVLVGVHPAPSVQGPCMRFVVVSDLHIPVRADQGTRAVVEAILAMEPPPAFVVDTGDATELGWRSEIDEYVARVVDPLEAAGIPVLTVPGNHDARPTMLRCLFPASPPAVSEAGAQRLRARPARDSRF